MPKMILSKTQREELLKTLHARFEKNMNRHKGLEWTKIEAKLNTNPQALWSLHEMERTGGEPDVSSLEKETGQYIFLVVQQKVPKGAEVSVTTV